MHGMLTRALRPPPPAPLPPLPSCAVGKFGAIMASLWLSYVYDKRVIFLIGAMWALGGGFGTLFLLPDTTGLELQELDRMQRYILEGRFHEYAGAAVSPEYTSLWERFVLRWCKVRGGGAVREGGEGVRSSTAVASEVGTCHLA